MTNATFVFYSKSANKHPGKGSHETGNPRDFPELTELTEQGVNWRRMLSNMYVATI